MIQVTMYSGCWLRNQPLTFSISRKADKLAYCPGPWLEMGIYGRNYVSAFS